MTTQIDTPDSFAAAHETKSPVSLGVGETISIIVTGFCAASLVSATFAGLAWTLLMPLVTLFGIPQWLIIALLVPVAPAAIWIFVWMFIRTVQTERALSREKRVRSQGPATT